MRKQIKNWFNLRKQKLERKPRDEELERCENEKRIWFVGNYE
jgi:hypothetical protein